MNRFYLKYADEYDDRRICHHIYTQQNPLTEDYARTKNERSHERSFLLGANLSLDTPDAGPTSGVSQKSPTKNRSSTN